MEKITPVVGMGATYIGYTDRHPYTIVKVSASGKTIEVQPDKSTRVDNNGMSEDQEYTFQPRLDGPISVVTLRKSGKWVMLGSTEVFNIGYRRRYHDYSF